VLQRRTLARRDALNPQPDRGTSEGTADVALMRKGNTVKLNGNLGNIRGAYQPKLVSSEPLYRDWMRRSRHRQLSRMGAHPAARFLVRSSRAGWHGYK